MFGLHKDRGAQLALMDAMVFFAVALVISSVFVANIDRTADSGASDVEAYVASLLQSFVGASLCDSVALEVPAAISIGPGENVGDCLAAELHSLREGTDPEAFEPLNLVLARILDETVAKPYWYTLSAYDQGDEMHKLLQIARTGEPSDEAYASSFAITDEDGSQLLIVLQLRLPAPALEIL